MDPRYILVDKCIAENDKLLDNQHWLHKYLDKDRCTCFLCKLCCLDNLSLLDTLDDSFRKDFQNNLLYICKHQLLIVLCIQRLLRMVMEYRGTLAQKISEFAYIELKHLPGSLLGISMSVCD